MKEMCNLQEPLLIIDSNGIRLMSGITRGTGQPDRDVNWDILRNTS